MTPPDRRAGRPAVDVFVPNRNYAHWLSACLDSVLSQEGVDVRVLVVDNASTDGSVALVEQAVARDPRVQLLRHERDLGLVQSLEEGLAWCRAEYAVNVSADDVLTPGSLARATGLLDARPEVGFVYGPAVLHREGRPAPDVRQRGCVSRVWDGDWWLGRCLATAKNPVFSPEVVMRTETAQRVGYSSELPRCADLGMWLGLAARSSVGHLRGSRQAVYRLHAGSMMGTQGLLEDVQSRWQAFSIIAEQDAVRAAHPGALRVAEQALAVEAVRTVEKLIDWRRDTPEVQTELLAFAEQLWPQVRQAAVWQSMERARVRPVLSPVRLGHLVLHKASYETRERARRERGVYGGGLPWLSVS